MEQTKQIVLDIVRAMVKYPDQVELHLSDDKDERGELTVINIKVAKEDIGVCIGKGGKNAEALRILVGIIGFNQTHSRVYVVIDAPKLPKNHYNN